VSSFRGEHYNGTRFLRYESLGAQQILTRGTVRESFGIYCRHVWQKGTAKHQVRASRLQMPVVAPVLC